MGKRVHDATGIPMEELREMPFEDVQRLDVIHQETMRPDDDNDIQT